MVSQKVNLPNLYDNIGRPTKDLYSLLQLDRLTGLKHLRVRGLAAVSYRVVLRALGVNILRAAAVMVARLA
jgi:hypothetical protein